MRGAASAWGSHRRPLCRLYCRTFLTRSKQKPPRRDRVLADILLFVKRWGTIHKFRILHVFSLVSINDNVISWYVQATFIWISEVEVYGMVGHWEWSWMSLCELLAALSNATVKFTLQDSRYALKHQTTYVQKQTAIASRAAFGLTLVEFPQASGRKPRTAPDHRWLGDAQLSIWDHGLAGHGLSGGQLLLSQALQVVRWWPLLWSKDRHTLKCLVFFCQESFQNSWLHSPLPSITYYGHTRMHNLFLGFIYREAEWMHFN